MIEKYERLYALHRENWEKNNKMFGFEVIAARYAATLDRLKYAKDCLVRYENGTLEKIEELEPEPKFGSCRGGFHHQSTFSRIAGA